MNEDKKKIFTKNINDAEKLAEFLIGKINDYVSKIPTSVVVTNLAIGNLITSINCDSDFFDNKEQIKNIEILEGFIKHVKGQIQRDKQ